MAKGNMLLGKSRGSVGDVTFSQINGQQIARARNRNPSNPRTLKQCFQRGRFAAAVKFYTRGIQALYKFAFENKRQYESDYNAFMRENVKIAPTISKVAFDNYDYPVIAPFIMSKGSLAPMGLVFESPAESAPQFKLHLGNRVDDVVIDTIGGLSEYFKTNLNCEEGDIITIVTLTSNYAGTYPSVDANGSGKTEWDIKQFIIDSSSTEETTSVTGMLTDEGVTASLFKQQPTSKYSAMCIIHSRNDTQGLKVSTQELVLNTTADTAYTAEQEEAYKEAVAVSWKTAGAVDMQPEAILQGSIAYGVQ